MLLNAARSLAFATIERAWDVACSGRVPEAALQAELRSVAVYATEAAADVTMMAYRYAGGGVPYDTNPIQRCFRDINAASQHFVVSDTSFEALAQFRLGLSDPNPLG
jgi:alkylation response protein AidB-like acyl-CoA dehydrogenase